MAERTTGIYALITVPAFYKGIQNILGGKKARKQFSKQYFTPFAGKRVLEVGCGPGTWVPELSMAGSYYGVDWNQSHIEEATREFGTPSVQFKCCDVSVDDDDLPEGTFDVVCAFGLLHHLDDQQVADLAISVSRKLTSGGVFLAIEPVYLEKQNWFARWLKDRDSGQNIRSQGGYLKIMKPHFSDIEVKIHTTMLRIPYSHCVLQAKACCA